MDDHKIRIRLLKRLFMAGAFCKGHMLEENILKTIDRFKWGRARKVFKELLKEGLIVAYGDTKHGVAYQLNIDRLREIEGMIDKELNTDKNSQ